MLPLERLDFEVRDGAIIPRFLTERDEPWIRELLQAQEDLVGLECADSEDRMRRVAAGLIHGGARSLAVQATRQVLATLFESVPERTIKPRELRRALYEIGAREHSRVEREMEAAGAARDFGLDPSGLWRAAFGDFPHFRRIGAPREVVAVRSLAERVNLALVQGIIRQAQRVDVVVTEQTRAIVRLAKLKRLLCTFAEDPGGTRIEVSGPLALFRATTKYGAALAAFVPQVASTTAWRIEARCFIENRACVLHVSSRDPIHRAHALPRSFDSDVERRLSRDLRRLRSRWSVRREAAAFRTRSGLVFPDFTLTDGEATIHVEVVAFWTDEYLARKRRALAEVTAPLLVCFDTSLGPLDAGAFGDKDVLPFRKTINASELVAKLDLMARRSGAAPPVVMPHRGSPRRLDETSSTIHHPGHRGDGSPD